MTEPNTTPDVRTLRDRIIDGERELDGTDPQTLCFLMAEHWKAVATEHRAKAKDYDRIKDELRIARLPTAAPAVPAEGAPSDLVTGYLRAWMPAADVIKTAEAAGFKWLTPDDDPENEFPGAFDISSLDDMRRLLVSLPTSRGAPQPACEQTCHFPAGCAAHGECRIAYERRTEPLPEPPSAKWADDGRHINDVLQENTDLKQRVDVLESMVADRDAFIQASPASATLKESEVVTLPPLDGLRSAWDWYVRDHDNAGHRKDCPDEHGCHCGFENLRRVIEGLTETALKAPPVAWQERQAKRMRDGVVTEWSGWYECRARSIDAARAEAPDHIPHEWRPLYASPLSAPAGWKVVPVEPTEAMVRAALDCQDADPEDGPEAEVVCAYRAMLAASPEANHA